jgi:hypothetical protein
MQLSLLIARFRQKTVDQLGSITMSNPSEPDYKGEKPVSKRKYNKHACDDKETLGVNVYSKVRVKSKALKMIDLCCKTGFAILCSKGKEYCDKCGQQITSVILLEDAKTLECKIQDLEIWNKKLKGKLELEPYALASQLVKMTNKAIEAELKITKANEIIDDLIKYPSFVNQNDLKRVHEVLNN